MVTQPLITRLSKLDAPDREVDAELEAVSLGGRVYLNDPESKEVIIERPIDGFWIRGIYPYRKIARYTASVDAVIALAERVLPGCDIEISDVHADFRGAKEPRHIADLSSDLVWEKHDGYPDPVYRIRGTGQSNIRAIALLIALLRAKEASNA